MEKPSGRTRSIVGANVRRLRRAKGLSQEALAELAGVHRTFVGHIERGETNVSLDTLERVADALAEKVSVLLEP